MRVLVTWGTKHGGTEGIARIIGEGLRRDGFDVDLTPASGVRDLTGYHAAIVGGALYANRWQHDARRLVARNVETLRRIPVWLFSSGPLDDAADRKGLAMPMQVAVLADRIGAIDHVTFGGRLAPDVKGFPAAAMAKKSSGDWRNPERIRAWATEVARAIPIARPRPATEPAARAPWRVVTHAFAGWMGCALVMAGLLRVTSTGAALALHAIAAPLIFTAIAIHYFRPRGAREALPVAAVMTAVVALLDAAIVAGLVRRSAEMFASFTGMWLPLALGFLAVWTTGFIMSTRPWPKRSQRVPTTTASDVPVGS